ncbi:MAG: MFS transporter [Spirochaetales bacterium]|nr:MFS transporter [Spirochaetales bacterium]
MEEKTGVFGYRWVVLLAFVAINIVLQIQWLILVPVRSAAMEIYGVTGPRVDFFAMSYMLLFILFCFPASYVLDTWGLKAGIGIGSALCMVGAGLKIFFPGSFWVLLAGQISFAIAQPFILNAITTISCRWFPRKERATATGLGTLSQYAGIIIAMLTIPLFVSESEINGVVTYAGLDTMHIVFGIITFVAAVIAFFFMKSNPPLPPVIEEIPRFTFFKGIGSMFRNKSMLVTIFVFFIGLGIFNAVSSLVEPICVDGKGLNMEQGGLVGGVMIIGGIVGAVIIPMLSDMLKKRKLFLVICLIGMVPSLFLLYISQSFALAMVASFMLGFFVMSAGPIGFQYAAEISYPTPESSSQGILLFVGQVSGLIFVAIMGQSDALMNAFMIGFIALGALSAIATFFLAESPMIITEKDKAEGRIPNFAESEIHTHEKVATFSE